MELTDEQRWRRCDVELAKQRAQEATDEWDVYYSPQTDRFRMAVATIIAYLTRRDLLAMTDGG